MNCPQCRHPGADGRNYCGACGGRLVQYCRLCGFCNQGSDRFCGGCGNGLAENADEEVVSPTSAPVVRPAPVPEPVVARDVDDAPPVDDGGLAELIAAARDSEKEEPEEGDIKVSQDDIDSLFGD